MKFSEYHLNEALGAILAHSLRLPNKALKKGTVLTETDLSFLKEYGYEKIVCAKLEEGDLNEDLAAAELAILIAGSNLVKGNAFTGRCNLFAEIPGLVIYDPLHLDKFNSVHESITLGTVAPFQHVSQGQMIATLKIIPFAIPSKLLKKIRDKREYFENLLNVAPYSEKKVTLIQSRLPGTKETVLNSTLEATRFRLQNLGISSLNEVRCNHDQESLSELILQAVKRKAELILISGASAVVDRRDVVPAAIEQAGGKIRHFGMPVDPGNLLLLGSIEDIDVIGIPGCARSPKLNGFDWVLQRLLANMPVESADIMHMGSGGLLKDIITRPLPRAKASQPDQSLIRTDPGFEKIHAAILAGGQSKRMGTENKLLVPINGKPMVVLASETITASKANSVTVITGFEDQKIKEAIQNSNIHFAHNKNFQYGISSSVVTAVKSAPEDCSAILIGLGDMPNITVSHINQLIDAYNPLEGRAICVPTWKGKRGNPVLWARRFFPEMLLLKGDFGAKELMGKYAELVVEVEMNDNGIVIDIDTPEALEAFTKQNHRSK
ncbi:MAG: NTP transferase domain-containing protein [Thalassobaculaceae bacterium]